MCSYADIDHLYEAICKKARKISPISFGSDALSKRLRQFGLQLISYKLVNHPFGNAEIALISGNRSIVSVNGSIVTADAFNLGASDEKEERIYHTKSLSALSIEKKWQHAFLLVYNTSYPQFTDTNKNGIIHNEDFGGISINNAFCNLQKGNKDKDESWILMDVITHCRDMKLSGSTNIFANAPDYEMSARIYALCLIMKDIAVKYCRKWGQMTVRKLYYELVSKGIIKSGQDAYKNMDGHLTNARKRELINPEWFEDRTRAVVEPKTVSSFEKPKEYVKKLITDSLNTPLELDLWEDQEYYVEIWIEKEALTSIFERVARRRQVALYPSRGYSSFTKLNEAVKRLNRKTASGKQGIILYFGDLDPSGWNIYETIRKGFDEAKEKKKLNKIVDMKRIMLEPPHIKTMRLIPMPVKEGDTRAKGFKKYQKEHNFNDAYELDAVDPEILISTTEKAIDKYFDSLRVPVEIIKAWRKKFDNIKKRFFSILDKTNL